MATQNNILNYYENLSADYDQNRFANTYGQYIHAQEQQLLQKHLAGDHILSLGCGTGRFMEHATMGLDISPNMLAEAQKKHPEKQFLVGDATATSLPDAALDTVFSLHVLMHLNRQQTLAVFKEMHRILKPGGHFIFDIPSTKRRRLTGYKAANWHAGNAWTINDLSVCLSDHWDIKIVRGILFFPIHKVPTKWRKSFLWLDTFLCRTLFREYASYLFLKIQKK